MTWWAWEAHNLHVGGSIPPAATKVNERRPFWTSFIYLDYVGGSEPWKGVGETLVSPCWNERPASWRGADSKPRVLRERMNMSDVRFPPQF